jgi:hypothetical protein
MFTAMNLTKKTAREIESVSWKASSCIALPVQWFLTKKKNKLKYWNVHHSCLTWSGVAFSRSQNLIVLRMSDLEALETQKDKWIIPDLCHCMHYVSKNAPDFEVGSLITHAPPQYTFINAYRM